MAIKNEICVIGIGRFGEAVVTELYNQNKYVFAIDSDEKRLKKVEKKAQTAIADATDVETLKELGLEKFQTFIVAARENIEISAALIELKAKNIIAKAKSKAHERVLRQIGVNVIIKPEVEAGIRAALIATNPNFLKFSNTLQEVGDGYVIGSTIINKLGPVNKAIQDLKFRELKTSVISIKRNSKVFLPTGDFIIQEGDFITLIGKIENIIRMFKKIKGVPENTDN